MFKMLLSKVKIVKSFDIFIFRQMLLCNVAIFTSINVGVIFGFTSLLFPQLENSKIILNNEQQSWIASITILAMVPSSLLSGWSIQLLGRRKMAFLSDIAGLLGWMTIYFAQNYKIFLLGRAIHGFYAGTAYPTFLTYLGEVISPKLRASFLTTSPIGMAVGIFIGQLLGTAIEWRTIALIACTIPIYTICVEFYLKESYVWFLNKGQMEKSQKSFEWFRGTDEVSSDEFKKTVQDNESKEALTFSKILRLCHEKAFLMPFGITTLVFLTNEVAGTLAIAFYTSSILRIISDDSDFEFYSNLFLNIIRIFATISSMYLVHKTSVRIVLIASTVALGISLLFLGLFLYLAKTYTEHSVFAILSAVALIADVLFYSIGLGSLPTAVCGEMYPIATRALGGSLSASLSFLMLFVVVKYIPLLFYILSMSITFMIFGICTLLGIGLIYLVLPNTKNKTLNEISKLYVKNENNTKM